MQDVVRRVARVAASSCLAGLAVTHAAWAAGSSWPFADRADLADAVIGAPDVPGPAACLAVSGALAAAAAIVGGASRLHPALGRAGRAGVAAVLAVRGGLGLAGRTSLVSPASQSERFIRLDRRVYSPACLALAVLTVLSA